MPLSNVKTRLRKVLLRARQFARNCDNRQAYTKVLNDHNAAALHKLTELRPLPPGTKATDRRAAQCTRDLMVPVWREQQLEAHHASGSEPQLPPPPPSCVAIAGNAERANCGLCRSRLFLCAAVVS